ncbi:BAQ_1a_G0017950.mRNA.1.CDS.1 [Saccharomyces cerevisiae]|nr:BAQ_1a_G0017950.mRNA.1.CDS.1 [Saccharomyces cerevisiae]CAI4459950.1 BAM_G0015090.mRNA.1.CDS.1 [Saccharomyces cerevisiae]CAI7110570.1 BAM_G0015090.mRNA.1.CDS.1 [Saccharomyces cerevisiae]CAI7112418.1 BAQ_1a_G0017950.mRNA.1.CDS.1 [Saccharomyces cerevisiae]
MPSEDKLGEEISTRVVNEYSKLKSACRPIIRPSGIREWTILAGVAAINKDGGANKIEILSIATGVKALPDSELQRSEGKILHDCHAEILALRSANTVLLNRIQNYNPSSGDKFIQHNDEIPARFNLKENWELALYISRLPCGDASMSFLNDNCKNDDFIKIEDSDEFQYVDRSVKTILRGRLNFNRRNVVRTKPGRYDSNITLSKSCSDKLLMKQRSSVLNCLNYELFEKPVFLKYIVIPNLEDETKHYLEQSFHTRLPNLDNEIKFLNCLKPFYDDKLDEEDVPGLMCSVKLFMDDFSTEEAILNGVRNGFYTKSSKPLRKHCQSQVSRFAQWELFKKVRPEYEGISYLEFKSRQKKRSQLIIAIKNILSPDGWIPTRTDDVK